MTPDETESGPNPPERCTHADLPYDAMGECPDAACPIQRGAREGGPKDDLEYEQYRKVEETVLNFQADKGGSLSMDEALSLLCGLLGDIRARLIRLERKAGL